MKARAMAHCVMVSVLEHDHDCRGEHTIRKAKRNARVGNQSKARVGKGRKTSNITSGS